jgi:hypothetical protein
MLQMLKWRREAVFDIYNLLFALFLFVTPWLFAYSNEDAKIDMWTSGAVIAAICFASFIAFSKWEEWINLLLGIWLIASPWVLGFAHTRAMHFSIGIGAVVAFMAALEIWIVYDAATEDHAGTEAGHPTVR